MIWVEDGMLKHDFLPREIGMSISGSYGVIPNNSLQAKSIDEQRCRKSF